ncbi:Cutinase transcription factor 1 beta [Colletotrichum tropicale]|nr:Cutinase transcription factor 1 beta [Colletotrichum tropicale]
MWNAWSLEAVEVARKIFVGAHRPAANVPTSQFSGHGGSSTDISMVDETATQIFRDAVDPDSVTVGASSQPVENAPRASSSNTSTSFSTSGPLPGFIEPLRACREGYVGFLEQQRAFHLPSLSLQSALLKAFIEFVYPRMPLLNLTTLCEAIESYDGGTKDFSLLLYQAILFAGSAHVKQTDLAGTEFSDKLCLRKTLYQRAELLFELGGPQDHLALVQAALLLTFRGISQDSQLDRKDSWHWMNTAVTLALDIGLNKEPSLKAFDTSEIKLRRRLWWCCYVRDKILALGMSKPSRIKDEDHSTAMISIHDMDLEALKTQRKIFGRIQLGPYDHVEMMESAELPVESLETSKRIVSECADNITRLAADLHQGQMDPYLPIGAITILCPAISTHLINMKNRNQGLRHAAVSGFWVCMRVLDKLRDLYPATEVTLAYLDVVLQKAQMESAISVRAVFQLNERDRSDMRMILGRHSAQSWDTSVTSKATDLGFAGLEDAMNQFEQFDTPEFSADYGAEASMGSTYHGTLLDPPLSPKDALGQVYFNDLNPWQCLDLGWIEDANTQLPMDDALIPGTTNPGASWFQDDAQ